MLKALYLEHFRNYKKAEVTFSSKVNWLIGDNAQGKTNILEAIYLLSCGRSFRTAQLCQLIHKNAPHFYIEALFEKDGVNQTIKLSYDGQVKGLQINATTHTHFTPLIGLLPMILYAPEDLTLVEGMPASRRKFLDLHLAHIDPLYLHHLARYHRALKQRNTLLKAQQPAMLDTWEEVMAPSALYLMQRRSALIEALKRPLEKTMATLSAGADKLTLRYQPSLSVSSSEEITRCLSKHRKRELTIGTTLIGPHRDDLLFSLDELSAKTYASVGQKHSIIAALRLCMWEHLREHTGNTPYFGVDDFGVHLDPQRQRRFEQRLQTLGQIFLTSPTATEETFAGKQVLKVASAEIFQVSCA